MYNGGLNRQSARIIFVITLLEKNRKYVTEFSVTHYREGKNKNTSGLYYAVDGFVQRSTGKDNLFYQG